MKKLLVLCTALFILVGCASKDASTSKNEVLFTVGKNKVTQDQIFQTMKATDGGALSIKKGQNILTKDISDETIQAEVDSLLAKQKDDLKNQFIVEVQKLGFETEEDYVEKNLKPYARIRHLLKTTLDEEYERVAQELIPRKVAVLETKTKDNAKKAEEMLKAGSSLSAIAAELNEEVEYKGETTLEFVESSKLPSAVLTFIRETNEPSNSEIIPVGAADDSFYLVTIVDLDVASMKEEVIEAAMDSNEISQKELAGLYSKNGFKVYDFGIYNALKKTHASYLAN